MSRMSGIFQSVYEMKIEGREIDEIAESLGVSKTLIENLDTNDYDYSNYLYPYQSENCNDTNIFC